MWRKGAVGVCAYVALVGVIISMIAVLMLQSGQVVFKTRMAGDRGDAEHTRRRPRSIQERMLAERESAGRGARAEERAASDDKSGEGGERDAFDQWFFSQRTFPAGTLPPNAIASAMEHSKAHNKDVRGAPGGGAAMWKALGPVTIPDGQTDATAGQVSPVSGRLNAIATHPANPNIVYAGGAQGGVWKTTNALSGKPTWTPLTDHEASLAVGAIAIDPVNPDIVYVGTGEANRSCDSYYGQGVLRSADGGLTWTLLGNTGSPFNNPGPFSGKSISKILIDPTTAGSTMSTTIWAATTIGVFDGGTDPACQTPSGPNVGLWRSSDSGQTWQLQNVPAGLGGAISVQDAALDPTNSNILYAAVRSTGVFKSTNAKAAAAVYANTANGFPLGSTATPLRRINVGIGGAAAAGVLYAAIENGAAGDRLWGLFKTTNGGASWGHVDDGANGTATFAVADADPGPGTLLLVQVTRVSGAPFVTDGTWTNRRLLITPGVGTSATLSRSIFRVDDADHLFLTTSSTGGVASGRFSVGNYPVYCDGQCFYDMTISVDPADGTGGRIYVGGNPHNFSPNAAPNVNEAPCNVFVTGSCRRHSNWRSDDGGRTWASISQGNGVSGSLHTDDHAYAFGADGSVYDGNDGGIWRSGDRGTSWTSMNTDIVITQFQGVALHPTSNVVIGGTQDNGTNLRDPSLQAPPAWFHADFGDGGMAVIDQSTPARMFHTYFNQAFNLMGPARSDNGGAGGPGSWPFVGAYFGYGPQYYNGMDPTDPVSFYAPLTQHPAFTPNVIYFGSNRIYRSPDPRPFIFTDPPAPPSAQPKSWKAVSPALTKAPSSPAYLTWIGVVPTLVNGKEVLYSGATDGRIAASSTVDGSGVATWIAIDKAPLPNRAVTQVWPLGSDTTGNTVYATFSGFNGATPAQPGHVFKSTNGLGAATWTDISGDLPDIPTNAIAIDEKTGTIYVGNDIGVFQTLDGGAHWTHLDNGMPNVAVFGLAIDKNGRLVAATHGRGMFELVKSGGPKK
jgi:photosystem II stability/assembly factor-like uncharacterized protein